MHAQENPLLSKVVILAGGLGTRLQEETVVTPKPLVTIGGKPVLWHIMKTYLHYGDDVPWELDPLESLAASRELMVYKHRGFWQCMDTSRDRRQLDALWESGSPPWKIWDDEAVKLQQGSP